MPFGRLCDGVETIHVNILGIRGIPAAHGGFETFAAHFAPYLKERGHEVLVYCQADEDAPLERWEDEWNGIHRVHIRPRRGGALGTMEFDWACVKDVIDRPGVDLVLGYNTALFNIAERLKGRRVVMNMDGIEWKRAKWSLPARAWFFLNELAGANICHVAIADHPEIAAHVAARSGKRPVMIPYGSDRIEAAEESHVRDLGLEPFGYFVSIARIEPENSILELVEAFSGNDLDAKLVVLGNLDDGNSYHRKVRAAAGPDVVFTGGIYEPERVKALRFYATAYLHGHTVGGTNPSLVEALGAGRPVIAHDNRFNRWTAGSGQRFFSSPDEAGRAMTAVLQDRGLQKTMGEAALARHTEEFTFDRIHARYEEVLLEAART